jgi:hypothetical protein
MSDTPETDAAVISSNGQWSFVLKETCRRIERERDEVLEKAERYRIEANAMMMQRDEWAAMCGRYKQDRDEARESLKHITEYGTEEINAAVDLRQKLASALVERDEAIRQRNETNESSVFSCNFYYEEKLKAERERNEIQEKYDKLATEHMLVVNKLCEERDEARAEIQMLRLDAQKEAEHHDRMVKELEELYDKLKS